MSYTLSHELAFFFFPRARIISRISIFVTYIFSPQRYISPLSCPNCFRWYIFWRFLISYSVVAGVISSMKSSFEDKNDHYSSLIMGPSTVSSIPFLHSYLALRLADLWKLESNSFLDLSLTFWLYHSSKFSAQAFLIRSGDQIPFTL